MTLGSLLFVCVGIFVVGALAYLIIKNFLPPESHKIALCVVGIVLLLVLLALFFPNVSGVRVW